MALTCADPLWQGSQITDQSTKKSPVGRRRPSRRRLSGAIGTYNRGATGEAAACRTGADGVSTMKLDVFNFITK